MSSIPFPCVLPRHCWTCSSFLMECSGVLMIDDVSVWDAFSYTFQKKPTVFLYIWVFALFYSEKSPCFAILMMSSLVVSDLLMSIFFTLNLCFPYLLDLFCFAAHLGRSRRGSRHCHWAILTTSPVLSPFSFPPNSWWPSKLFPLG